FVGPVLLVRISACGVTVVTTTAFVALPSLFPGVGSLMLLVVVTRFVSVVALAGAVTVKVILLLAALVNVAIVQVTFVLVTVPPEAPVTVTPVGNVSITSRFVTVEAPAFVTLMV